MWESRLVELFSDTYTFYVGKAKYIPNIQKYIWTVIKESNLAVDSVLEMEKYCSATCTFPKYTFEQRGTSTIQTYSREFSEYYHSKLNKMVERRMKASVLSISSFWYTAWVDAGQPNLNSLINKIPSIEYVEQLQKLEEKYNADKLKNRICEH